MREYDGNIGRCAVIWWRYLIGIAPLWLNGTQGKQAAWLIILFGARTQWPSRRYNLNPRALHTSTEITISTPYAADVPTIWEAKHEILPGVSSISRDLGGVVKVQTLMVCDQGEIAVASTSEIRVHPVEHRARPETPPNVC